MKGLGQKWTDEAFEIFGERIKSITVEWKLDNRYPGNSSLGFKEYTKAFDELGDDFEAVKRTTFYNTMSKRNFSKVEFVDWKYEDFNLISIIVILKK